MLSVVPLKIRAPERSAPTTASRILDLVVESPGLPVGVLMARLEIGSGTAQYHIRRLEDAGRVHTIVIGRRRLVFPGPLKSLLDEHAHAHALLRGSSAHAIARAVIENPACSVLHLIALTGESPRSVYYHLKRLRDAGLIGSGSQRRYLQVVPTPLLLQLAAQLDADE